MDGMRKGKKPETEWKKQVDHALWTYSCAKWSIDHQNQLIRELEQRGRGFTGGNRPEEGVKEAVRTAPQEELLLSLEKAKRRRSHLQEIRRTTTALLDWLYPEGTEEREFVEAYWLSAGTLAVGVRTEKAVEKLPFLAQDMQKRPLRGNRNFYLWRNRIYEQLAMGFGYLA